MPTKTWECEWQGHRIKVENYWNWLMWWRERLFIDDNLADENQGWGVVQTPKLTGTLTGKIKHREAAFPVKVLIGQANLGMTVDCKIWVDSELVYPDKVE